MRLYKPTEILRCTVSQELKRVIAMELDAPAGSYRKVQILVPREPIVHVSLARDADEKFGMNRDYKSPPLRDSTTIAFSLMPGQEVWLQAQNGLAQCTGIIEYCID